MNGQTLCLNKSRARHIDMYFFLNIHKTNYLFFPFTFGLGANYKDLWSEENDKFLFFPKMRITETLQVFGQK